MNVVRLCFQCELEREDGDRTHLYPVVSNPIYDKSKINEVPFNIVISSDLLFGLNMIVKFYNIFIMHIYKCTIIMYRRLEMTEQK